MKFYENFKDIKFIVILTACIVFVGTSTAAELSKYIRPNNVPQPINNRITPQRVELGKMLFFDPRLSGSNWISCGTCHNPSLGWSDGLPTAIGHGQKVLGRATPTIMNAAYIPLQMWDGRFRSLEKQALKPMEAIEEMNQNPDEVVKELQAIAGYRDAFEAAYKGEGISIKTIAKAIASFERTIVSNDAAFDRWIKGDKSAMSESSIRGFKIFEGKANCVKCHSGFNFSDNGFHNIGLKDARDAGRYAIRKVKILIGAFKTPTLRDVALTAPYMHNGAYTTLKEVVEHYDRGGDAKENLSPNINALNLTEAEKDDLVEFMKSLTGEPLQITFPRLPQ